MKVRIITLVSSLIPQKMSADKFSTVELRELSHLQPYSCTRQGLLPHNTYQAPITKQMDQRLSLGNTYTERLFRDCCSSYLHLSMQPHS